jgi:hypothetical protein
VPRAAGSKPALSPRLSTARARFGMDLSSKVKTGLDEARMLVLGCEILVGFQFQAASRACRPLVLSASYEVQPRLKMRVLRIGSPPPEVQMAERTSQHPKSRRGNSAKANAALASVMERNIASLIERRRREEARLAGKRVLLMPRPSSPGT